MNTIKPAPAVTGEGQPSPDELQAIDQERANHGSIPAVGRVVARLIPGVENDPRCPQIVEASAKAIVETA